MSYDAFGEMTEDDQPSPSSINHATAPTIYHYNALGKLYRVNGPRQIVESNITDTTNYSYDVLGNLISTASSGLSGQDTYYFFYNDAGQMVRAKSPLTSSYVIRDYTYDSSGLLQKYQIGNQTTCYSYDRSGRVTSTADPRFNPSSGCAASLWFRYDNYGNLVDRYKKLGSGAKSDEETSTFDEAGNKLTGTATGSSVTMGDDHDGRISSVSSGSASTAYTYDATSDSQGRLYSINDSSVGTTFFKYDSNKGLLSQVSDPFTGTSSNPFGGSVTQYTYDGGGRITKRTDPAGLTWTRSYDARSGDVLTQNINSSATDSGDVASSSYVYDIAGNVVTDHETVQGGAGNGTGTGTGTWSYTYDDANRLKSSDPPLGVGATETYTYDGMGNRTSVQKGGNTVTKSYDSRGLPSTVGNNSYQFDEAGNMLQTPGGTKTYSYDAWDRMTSATVNGGAQQTYSYDALGRLISAGPSGSASTFTYQGDTFNRVTSTTGTSIMMLAYTPNGPLAQKKSGASASVRYYLKNLHGDITGLVGTSSTTPTTTETYSPWGEVVASTPSAPTTINTPVLGYQGQPTDAATGLVETDTRYYDPSMGRFDTQDALFGAANDYGSLNQYVYGDDSPVAYDDPSGMAGGCNPGARCQQHPAGTGGNGGGGNGGGGNGGGGDGGGGTSAGGSNDNTASGQGDGSGSSTQSGSAVPTVTIKLPFNPTVTFGASADELRAYLHERSGSLTVEGGDATLEFTPEGIDAALEARRLIPLLEQAVQAGATVRLDRHGLSVGLVFQERVRGWSVNGSVGTNGSSTTTSLSANRGNETISYEDKTTRASARWKDIAEAATVAGTVAGTAALLWVALKSAGTDAVDVVQSVGPV